jgi:thioredoxin-related protein
MNEKYSDKNVANLEGISSIPTRSACLFKKLPAGLRADRTGKWIYFLPLCIALTAYLWLGCPECLRAADKPNFLDYETALQNGKDSQRPLLVFFTTPWCYQCKEMKRKIFENKDIVSILNERFLLVEVDISQERKLKEDFRINYVPTSLFLDIHGRPIIDLKGYIPTDRFRKLMQYVSEGHYKTTAFSDFEKK